MRTTCSWHCLAVAAFGQDLFLALQDPYMYAADEWHTGPGTAQRAGSGPAGPGDMPSPKPALGFQPNIVFILADDQDTTLGRDGYSAKGSLEAMPKLDQRLTREGASFTRFYVNTPICCPSRTEFFSGRYYHNVGPPTITDGRCMHVDTTYASKNNTGIFGLMKSAGYNVGLFGKVTNDQRKILDEIVEFKSASFIDSPLDYNNYLGKTYYKYDESTGADPQVEKISGDDGECYQTSQIGNRSLSWLDTAIRGDAPFFAYLGPHAPHFPAMPAPWYATAFDDVELPITPNYNMLDTDGDGKSEHAQKNPPLSDRAKCWEKRHFQNRWASLLSVDDLVEAVYSKVEAAGLLDRTYFVYTSDHGYKFGQWRIGTSKQHPYETDIRIPFIIRGPGIEKGSQPSQVSANVDLLPTLLELAAGPVYAEAAGVDGRSMVPFLVPTIATAQGAEWRHHLINEYKSVGTYGNDHSDAWQNGTDTTKACGGKMPLAPEGSGITKTSDCLASHGMSNGKCYLVDSTASNNWRQLRIVNATHNWNYVEYDPAFTFQTASFSKQGPCSLKVLEDTACTKKDVHDTSTQDNAEACCAHCTSDALCVQWTFHDTGKCFLSGTVQGSVSQSNTTCGMSPPAQLQHYELYDQAADVYQMTNIYSTVGVEMQRWLHETVDAYFHCSGAECP